MSQAIARDQLRWLPKFLHLACPAIFLFSAKFPFSRATRLCPRQSTVCSSLAGSYTVAQRVTTDVFLVASRRSRLVTVPDAVMGSVDFLGWQLPVAGSGPRILRAGKGLPGRKRQRAQLRRRRRPSHGWLPRGRGHVAGRIRGPPSATWCTRRVTMGEIRHCFY